MLLDAPARQGWVSSQGTSMLLVEEYSSQGPPLLVEEYSSQGPPPSSVETAQLSLEESYQL